MRRPGRFCVDRCSVKRPTLATLDNERGQSASTVSARIDTDPVVPRIDNFSYRVAMDHDKAMLAFMIEEGGADPAEVGLAL